MYNWDSLYNNVTGITLPEAVGIVMIAIPGYILFKDLKNHRCYQSRRLKIREIETHEEDIIESKIRSESIRPGPPFVDSHQYHLRRVERVKTAYSTAWNLVNQNLDQGNKSFKIAVVEDDLNLLNVVQRLLIEELSTDGYKAAISIDHVLHQSNLDKFSISYEENDSNKDSGSVHGNDKYDFYFDIRLS